MSSNLKLRLISSIVMIIFFIPTIFYFRTFFNIIICILALMMIYEWYKMGDKNSYYLFFVIIMCIVSFSTLMISYSDSKGLFLLTIISMISAVDCCAMITGKIIKGPKLIPKISPNNTYSGFIGGIMGGSVIVTILTSIYSLNYFYKKEINMWYIVLVTIILSIITQLSDLFISYFKRKFNCKDTGRIIPGHGGVIDRFDGYILTMPTIFFYLSYTHLIEI